MQDAEIIRKMISLCEILFFNFPHLPLANVVPAAGSREF